MTAVNALLALVSRQQMWHTRSSHGRSLVVHAPRQRLMLRAVRSRGVWTSRLLQLRPCPPRLQPRPQLRLLQRPRPQAAVLPLAAARQLRPRRRRPAPRLRKQRRPRTQAQAPRVRHHYWRRKAMCRRRRCHRPLAADSSEGVPSCSSCAGSTCRRQQRQPQQWGCAGEGDDANGTRVRVHGAARPQPRWHCSSPQPTCHLFGPSRRCVGRVLRVDSLAWGGVGAFTGTFGPPPRASPSFIRKPTPPHARPQ